MTCSPFFLSGFFLSQSRHGGNMRLLFSSLLVGLFVGAVSPIGLILADATCDDLDHDHESISTCCGCTHRDWSDDRVFNNHATLGVQICPIGENISNGGTFTVQPAACSTVSAQSSKLFSTGATRITDCTDQTKWKVSIRIGASNECFNTGQLEFETECNCS